MDRDVQSAFDSISDQINYSISEMHRIEDQRPRGTTAAQRVTDLLRRSGKAMTPRQVTDALNQQQVKIDTVRSVLADLHNSPGPIRRAEGSRYSWHEEGRP